MVHINRLAKPNGAEVKSSFTIFIDEKGDEGVPLIGRTEWRFARWRFLESPSACSGSFKQYQRGYTVPPLKCGSGDNYWLRSFKSNFTFELRVYRKQHLYPTKVEKSAYILRSPNFHLWDYTGYVAYDMDHLCTMYSSFLPSPLCPQLLTVDGYGWRWRYNCFGSWLSLLSALCSRSDREVGVSFAGPASMNCFREREMCMFI